MTGTWLSIIPPLLAIGFAIWTRKVFLALLIGIVSGSFFISNFSILDTLIHTLYTIVLQLADIEWNIPIILFVLLLDRKSTRLNSSHVSISYAVFCLKKKKSSQVTS